MPGYSSPGEGQERRLGSQEVTASAQLLAARRAYMDKLAAARDGRAGGVEPIPSSSAEDGEDGARAVSLSGIGPLPAGGSWVASRPSDERSISSDSSWRPSLWRPTIALNTHGCWCGLEPVVVLCVITVASMSFNSGYDIGVMSGAKRLIEMDMGLKSWEVSLLVGSLNIISGVGGLLSGRICDTIGRKRTIALSTVVCIVGGVGMAVAPNFAVLMGCRVVNGIGIGFAFQVSPLYVAEVAPKHVRGRLVSCFDLFVNVGILCGYVASATLAEVHSIELSWRLMLGLGALPPLLVLCVLPILPETPR